METELEKWFVLQTDEILRLIQEQALKRWWIAECAGVHKTTLRRWLDRDIRKVHQKHVAALAAVLGVKVQSITRSVFVDENLSTDPLTCLGAP